MKKLNICIDIDGTITDPYYWLESANSYFNLNVKKEQVTEYSIANVLKIPEEAYDKFYEEKKYELHREEKLREDAKEILDILYEENNIYFVTARDKSLELLSIQYLKNHKIPYDEVFVLGTAYKVPAATKLQSDIFIEDSYDNALQLSSSGFKVLLLDTYYNRLPLNSNITRVNDWSDIYKIISDLTEKEEVIDL